MKKAKQPEIRAECHSDDRNIEVEFDAAPWFRKASTKAMFALTQCGWRGDYPADDVAHFEAGKNKEVAFMFRYLEMMSNNPCKKDCMGFECSVNSEDAIGWLRDNRPKLVKTVRRIMDDPAAYDVRTGKFSSD